MKLSILSLRRLPLVIVLLAIAVSSFAFAQEKIIYRFEGGNDGQNPYAGLVPDKSGNLYGTTLSGGSIGGACGLKGCGTVYELNRQNKSWTETVLYRFQNTPDGAGPAAPLVFDNLGNLFGIAASGGTSFLGTIFELSPPAQQGGVWTETTLFNFTDYGGGESYGFAGPGLIIDASGNLYGENPGAATNNYNGYIFQLAPPAAQGGAWTYSVLYTFKGSLSHDGSQPEGGLRMDKSGNLYGATEFGGINSACRTGSLGCGTAFELKHPAKEGDSWTEKVLYIFTGQNDGGQPVGGVRFAPNGTGLYGTTFDGGSQRLGVVFQLTASKQGVWNEAVLYTFLSSDGGHPNSGLVFDKAGTLYGTTFSSLRSKNGGAVFELTPPQKQGDPWNERTLAGFGGGGSTSGVILNNAQNALYGTLTQNGIGNMGIVYTVALP